MKATILGGGAWGTAVALHLSKLLDQESPLLTDVPPVNRRQVLDNQANPNQANHHQATSPRVTLWVRNAKQAESLRTERVNAHYLPGIALPANIDITSDWEDALSQSGSADDLIILATPLSALAQTAQQLCQYAIQTQSPLQNWILLSKGIAADTGLLPHEIVDNVIQSENCQHLIRYGILSGPSFAKEVALGLPCALTIASQFKTIGELTQALFHHGSMRIYVSDDVTGVELGGAMKNVLAIATGIADGLNLGLNARAALITRGMNEMSQLGLAMGARLETFLGLAGLGDLILTATGDLSRNRTVGLELAKNQSLDTILKHLGHVAEGVRCALAIEQLAKKHQVEVPIISAVCSILFRGVQPKDAVMDLMSRDPRQS